MSPELRPGITHEAHVAIGDHKTVPHIWPEFAEFGEMPRVLATGFMVALIEGVCQRAIKPYLDWPREQSVGRARQDFRRTPRTHGDRCRTL